MTTTKTTETIDYLTYPRLEARHAVKANADFPQKKQSGLSVFANVDDVRLKRASSKTQEGAARDMVAAIERAEQIAIRANPPIYCRGYVERADYSITSLYSDYKMRIESGRATWSGYTEERKKWHKCRHKFCLNMFPTDKRNFKQWPAKRSDSRFCSDGCRTLANDAERRFKYKGSYLPEWYYLPRLSESVDDSIREWEVSATTELIELAYSRNLPQTKKRHKPKFPKSSGVTVYKSREEAERAYDESEETGRIKI